MAQSAPLLDADMIADCVQRFRVRRPHVHCITNAVAQHFTANVLLAAGATPSMTIAEREISDFVRMSDALLVNLGTMDDERQAAIEIAISTANAEGKPWALDPVFVQASPSRLKLASDLLMQSPTLVRSNKSEAEALFVSFDAVSKQAVTVALTGEQDTIFADDKAVSLRNGAPVMDRVTAMGCALNAVMIGFAAVEADTLLAAASALSLYNIAGEAAAEMANGPGTFVPHFLDCLANIEPKTLAERVKFYEPN